ncbi:DUF6252 family protein [Flexithrix dorotheae]|uniref:DUF6252 family protein n=1 Tax=Flexithrix dorotheae TaxID=70993 RepID=UPI00036CE139|nr:DUF6252 family protein [Flexithrix dorotheae]
MKNTSWPVFSLLLILIPVIFGGCSGDQISPINRLVGMVNGDPFESLSIQAKVTTESNGELRILINAQDELNEAIFVGIQETEQNILGTHEVILNSGEFLGYREPGSLTTIETQSSFNCSPVLGTIFISEFNQQKKTISGTFEGTVCSFGGVPVIALTQGEFVSVNYQ